jgi:signal transduction histidine kinase
MVDHLQWLNRQMSDSLFRLVRDLRPAQLDDLGLVPALGSLIQQDCQQKGLQVVFDVRGNATRLQPIVETVLFRVAQEALNNVCRHAGVAHVALELRYDCDRVTIRIVDQGVGFNPAEKFHAPRGWGLAGMRERVEALSGQLTLRSAPGAGTSVEVVIPLEAQVERESVNGSN